MLYYGKKRSVVETSNAIYNIPAVKSCLTH
jgi:hypothetical protein